MPAEPRGPVAGDVEDARDVRDLGDDGDRDEEDQDRADPLGEVEQLRGRSPHGSRRGPRAARAGAAGVSVDREALLRPPLGSACGVRASAPTSHRWRATRPRVCLAMCVAPGTRDLHPALASGPCGTHAAAYVLERQSTTTPAAGHRGEHVGQGLAPDGGERAERAEVDAHRQAVRRAPCHPGAARRTGRRRRPASGSRGAARPGRARRGRARRTAPRCRGPRRRPRGRRRSRVLRAMSAVRLALTPSRTRRVAAGADRGQLAGDGLALRRELGEGQPRRGRPGGPGCAPSWSPREAAG